MGETALHCIASHGDVDMMQRILPKCDDTFIMQKSEFRLTQGLDALHTAMIFQHEQIATMILGRLGHLWQGSQYGGGKGLELLKELLSVEDPCTGVTTIMLMCRSFLLSSTTLLLLLSSI
jgi:hypothetical protein